MLFVFQEWCLTDTEFNSAEAALSQVSIMDEAPSTVLSAECWCHQWHLRAMAIHIGLPIIIEFQPHQQSTNSSSAAPGPWVVYSPKHGHTNNTHKVQGGCQQLNHAKDLNRVLRTTSMPSDMSRPIMVIFNAPGVMAEYGQQGMILHML